MADEKAVQRRPRGTPIDRGIRLMKEMDDNELRDFGAVVRGFVAARVGWTATRQLSQQAMLELGERAADGDE